MATGIGACITKNGESKATATQSPGTDDSYDHGTASLQWRNAYYSGLIYINGANNINETVVVRSKPSVQTIPLAETARDTISITIPAHWNTYDIEAVVSNRVDETGTGTANNTIRERVRETDVNGTVVATTGTFYMGTSPPDTLKHISLFGYAEGETTTGSRDYVLTANASIDDLDYSMTSIQWKVTATRVT